MTVLDKGLLIAFDSAVINGDLTRMSVIVLTGSESRGELPMTCWCEPEIKLLSGVRLPQECRAEGEPAIEGDPAAEVNGVLVLFANPNQLKQPGRRFKVRLLGDLIRGKHHTSGEFRGGDFNHLPKWLPDRRTGDGVEGGNFESWFEIGERGANPSLNAAGVEDIVAVFSNQPDSRRVAEAVVAARPFSSWSDVDAIPGIGSARMKRLKDNFDLD